MYICHIVFKKVKIHNFFFFIFGERKVGKVKIGAGGDENQLRY
jgi:hypothetical protein